MSVLDANSNFNYRWTFKDYPKNQHNLKVFSTFACGGGSTMGYKLAGYDVIGSNDIDPQLAEVYRVNHHPKFQYVCPIKDMTTMELPEELYNLDILDGSPPCSTFSIAGLRDKAWGKEKHFREGQAVQVLDDLFFDFLDLVERLQPKIVVAENVSGMLKGNAKGYLILIKERLTQLGYETQIFLLDASTMGVPQRRQRVFIIANRMNYPKLKLNFNEPPINARDALSDINSIGKTISAGGLKHLQNTKPGGLFSINGSNTGKLNRRLHPRQPSWTVTSSESIYHWKQNNRISQQAAARLSSFPNDYNYLKVKPWYLSGMSVPPVMMAQVANQIYLQWLGV